MLKDRTVNAVRSARLRARQTSKKAKRIKAETCGTSSSGAADLAAKCAGRPRASIPPR